MRTDGGEGGESYFQRSLALIFTCPVLPVLLRNFRDDLRDPLFSGAGWGTTFGFSILPPSRMRSWVVTLGVSCLWTKPLFLSKITQR